MTPNELIDKWQGQCEGKLRNGFLINGRDHELGVERIFDHKKFHKNSQFKYVCDLLKCDAIKTTYVWGHRFYYDDDAKAYTLEEFNNIPWSNEIDYETVIPLGEKFTDFKVDETLEDSIKNHMSKFGLPPNMKIRGNVYFHREGSSGRMLVPNDSTMNLCNWLINEYNYKDRGVHNG